MADLELIKAAAEKVLVPPEINDTVWGKSFFDRACRSARHCRAIAQLPDVRRFHIDLDCLQTAALFYDAGPVWHLSRKPKPRRHTELNDPALRQTSADITRQELSEILQPSQLDRICDIITHADHPHPTIAEAMILADARSLDEVGAVGLFQELHSAGRQGRTLTDLLRVWKRKIEYDYWPPRIREGFRFDSVRQLAQRRLDTALRFVNQLEIENQAADMQDITPTTQTNPSRINETPPISPASRPRYQTH